MRIIILLFCMIFSYNIGRCQPKIESLECVFNIEMRVKMPERSINGDDIAQQGELVESLIFKSYFFNGNVRVEAYNENRLQKSSIRQVGKNYRVDIMEELGVKKYTILYDSLQFNRSQSATFDTMMHIKNINADTGYATYKILGNSKTQIDSVIVIYNLKVPLKLDKYYKSLSPIFSIGGVDQINYLPIEVLAWLKGGMILKANLVDLQIGKQYPASFFEIPKGYLKE